MEIDGPYAWAFEHCSEALVMLDTDDSAPQMNRAARELANVNLATLLRAPSTELVRFRGQLQRSGRASVEVHVDRGGSQPRCVRLEGRRDGRRVIIAVQDATERAQADEELRQLRRAESVAYLTATLAHDFNNLLTVIGGTSAVLESEGTDRELLVEEIRLATERATSIVRQLLRRMRREPAVRCRTNLNAVVYELRPLLERLVGDHVSVALRLDPELAETVVDRDALEHALLNLAANARDAMPRGGGLTITTANIALGEGESPAAAGGRYVGLFVTDTGIGMSPEVRERIHDRLFTTKGARGTGLGLAMVRRFAIQSGGCVAVNTLTGQGTSIVVYLPARDEAHDEPAIDALWPLASSAP